MKPKIIIAILSMIIVTSCEREFDCYFTSENLYAPFYPYFVGQKVQFHNAKGDTLAYTINIEREDSLTQLSYGCDCICNKGISYELQSEVSYNIILNFRNMTRSPRKTDFNFSCLFTDINADWREYFIFGDSGNDRYFEKVVGEKISYLNNPFNDNRYSDGKHIQNVVHEKNTGLVSFYDADNACTWFLVEQ